MALTNIIAADALSVSTGRDTLRLQRLLSLFLTFITQPMRMFMSKNKTIV